MIDDSSERTYRYGDFVGFSCHRGHKFHGNLLTETVEFKLQCSANGTWEGFVPDCVSRTCPWPDRVANARIFLRKQDGTTVEIPMEGDATLLLDRREIGTNGSDVLNGISPETFVSGAEIIIVCDPGHELIGDRVRTCTEEERWSSFASCEPRNCSVADHPIFQFLKRLENETALGNGDTDVASFERWYNRENVTRAYKDFEIFVEGNSYARRVILMCRNGAQMNLHRFIANETISNIIWACNKIAKWEVSNLSLRESILEQLLNDSTDICNRSCAPPQVSFLKT